VKDKGFIFDYAKCVGCHACIIACYNENRVAPPISWRNISSFNSKKIPLYGFLHLSLACNHCKEAPCLKACPARAYTRDLVTGAIIHNPKRCIGCKYCTWVCPFDAPKFNPKTNIIEKCNFCNHLLLENGIPACANNCPTGALSYSEINEVAVVDSLGFTKNKIFPKINTKRNEVSGSIPTMNPECNTQADINLHISTKLLSKISAGEEWPLILFTLIASILSGWFISGNLFTSQYINTIIYTSIGVVGIILSTFHLGKPLRAPYSIINIKSSWLSREILFFAIFFTTSLLYIHFYKNDILFYTSIISSILMLISIDFVYLKFNYKYLIPQSASALVTAILFAFLFSSQANFVIIILGLKAILYLLQKQNRILYKRITFLSLSRFVFGFLTPLILIISFNSLDLSVPCIILGELIDRYEFYDALYIETPQNNLNKAIANMGRGFSLLFKN